MQVQKAQCGGYVASYHKMHAYGRTHWEAMSELLAWFITK